MASGGETLDGHSITASEPGQPGPDETIVSRIITIEDDNSLVEAGTKEVIRVDLRFQSGTGYLWHPEVKDEAVLRLITSRSVDISDKGTTGGPVLGMWYFETLAPGSTELEMLYYRDWEGKEKAAKKFRVRLDVIEKR